MNAACAWLSCARLRRDRTVRATRPMSSAIRKPGEIAVRVSVFGVRLNLALRPVKAWWIDVAKPPILIGTRSKLSAKTRSRSLLL